MGAPRAGKISLGPIHEAVENERIVRAEQFRHPDALGHARLTDTLEYIVFRDLASHRQRAALRCNGLDLSPKRDFVV
jgi:hypothetical protein